MVLGSAWLVCGCSSNGGASSAASEEAAVLAAAPKEWPAFLKWCEIELEKKPAAVPLPTNPNLPAAKWPVVRVLDGFAKAKVAAKWTEAARKVEPLLRVGPFRSDALSDRFAALKSFQQRYGNSYDFVVRGLSVNRDEAGAISITIRAPFGKFIDLGWSSAGIVRLPIPDNAKFWTLTVATDGLPDWHGVLNDLQIHMDGVGEGLVEIKSLEFLPREDLYPKAADLCRVTVSHFRQDAVYVHGPATLTFDDVAVPKEARFTFGAISIAADEKAASAPADEPTIEVVIRAGGVEKSVAKVPLEKAGVWREAATTLAEFGGQQVTVELRVSGGAADRVVLWANPTIYQPVENAPVYVLYLIDTLASRRMGLYGHSRPTTPRIGALAERGVWFAKMRPEAPVTVTSVAQLMLSMPTERHGVYMASIAIPPALVTMAETFQAAGYATASFVTSEYAGPRQGMDQGFDFFDDRVSLFWREPLADRTVPIEETLDWLKRHADRPAFVYIHTAEPHAPYAPPAGFDKRFDPEYKGTVTGMIEREHGMFAAKTPEDIEHVRTLYDEEVLYADYRFGNFEDAVKESGLGERTNYFVIADHGEELLEHGNWGHGDNVYEELLRIPLVAAGPAISGRGRSDVPACMYDVLPTLLDLTGLPPPYPLSGQTLAKVLRPEGEFAAPPAADRTQIVAHFQHIGLGLADYAVTEALRWKLIVAPRGKDIASRVVNIELYDLANDPQEQNNLLTKNPEIAKRLLVRLIAYHRQQHPYVTDGGALQYDPKQLRDLKSMGYVGE